MHVGWLPSKKTALLIGLGFAAQILDCSHGFAGYPTTASLLAPFQRTIRLLATSNDGNSSEEEEDIDVEVERKRLEALLGGGGGTTQTEQDPNQNNQSNNKLLTLPISEWKKEMKSISAPLLTSIGRERMEMEITLLESLAESDDAIAELWNLWYNARGPEAAKDLMKTEALVGQGQPEAWAEAEKLLKELIAREGIHWAEPVNRLATLKYLQSRHEESKELCEIVLALKPWHFGALSGMVMVHQGLQDTEGMLQYARQRMPPLPKKGQEEKEPPKEFVEELETRQMWVDRMLDRARAMLLGLEMGLEESFLDLDKQQQKQLDQSSNSTTTVDNTKRSDSLSSTSSSSSSQSTTCDEEEDAWQ